MKNKSIFTKISLLILLFGLTNCENKQKGILDKVTSVSKLIIPKDYEVFENSVVKTENDTVENLKLRFGEKSFALLVHQADSLKKGNTYWDFNGQEYSFFHSDSNEKQNLMLIVPTRILIFYTKTYK